MSRTALVTGVTGQDGGLLAEQLVAQGWHVAGALRPSEAPPQHLTDLGPALSLHEVDLLDEAAVAALVAAVAPTVVVNLAGVSSVARSWDAPVETLAVNGTAVGVLLQAVWDHAREARVVQASSAELFAGATTAPQDERTPVRPRSPYGAAKALGHHLVEVYRARGLHASSALLYNHESTRRPASFVTRRISLGVAAVAAGREQEVVLGDLDVRRDWGWAPEYVDALLRAGLHDEPGDYVVATGESHSVREFALTAFAAAGVADGPARLRSDAARARPADAVELVGDASRARTVLGWEARVRFDEVVRRMVEHDLALARAQA